MRPHRQQPTRLPRPWDSPGKNTGVGCHFLLRCVKVKSESEVTQLCLTLSDPRTAAFQAPPSMGFSRQEYWSGVPLPSPHRNPRDVRNDLTHIFGLFCRNWDPPLLPLQSPPKWRVVTPCWPQALRPQPGWNQKTEIPVTSSCYLTINQSEEKALELFKYVSHSCSLTPSPKTPAWKSSGSSGLLSMSCPFSLFGVLQINPYFAANVCCQILAVCTAGSWALVG